MLCKSFLFYPQLQLHNFLSIHIIYHPDLTFFFHLEHPATSFCFRASMQVGITNGLLRNYIRMHYTSLEAYEVQPCELLIVKNKCVWYVVPQIKPGEPAVQLPARSTMVGGSTACLPDALHGCLLSINTVPLCLIGNCNARGEKTGH